MYSETRVCIICRKPYIAHHPHQLACSDKCKAKRKAWRRKQQYDEAIKRGDNPYSRKPVASAKPVYKPPEPLDLIAWKAKKAGMSYGKYVATH